MKHVQTFFVQHEDASVKMFDHMVTSNDLLYEFAKYHFEEIDLEFIREQIAGPRECATKKVNYISLLLLLSFLYRQQ